MSQLQREVERLSQALLKTQEGECVLREKTTSLNQSLQEAATAHSSAQSRLAALQKTLTVAEQDKRLQQVSEMHQNTSLKQRGCNIMFSRRIFVIKERMDEARASLTEVKRNVATLTERVQSLQGELNQSEMRGQELEAELSNTQEVKIISDMSQNTVFRGPDVLICTCLSGVRLCVSARLLCWRLSAAPSQLRLRGPL